jgi:hypothetical protein
MKKSIYISLFLILIFTSKISLAQPCASAVNIYTFTAAGVNYEIVKELKTWVLASSCAVSRGGYLVHIDNLAEQTAVYNAIVASGISTSYHAVADGGGASYIWIGATDKNTEGVWLWDGNNDNIGTNFWNGQGLAGAGTGSVVGSNYVNFGGKSLSAINEPDDYVSNQDCAGICLGSWPYGIASEWNDIAATNTLYYIIEYPITTSMTEPTSKLEINAYPNPVSSQLTIEGRFSSIVLTNLEGKRINVAIQKVENKMLVDMSHLTSGTYFLKCTDLLNNQIVKQIVLNNQEHK